MKRPYEATNSQLTILPKPDSNDPKSYRMTLEGTHKLLVTKVVDISKPTEKPLEEIEPEENEDENKQNKSGIRMLQLYLKDLKGTEMKAVETEFIETLNSVKANYVINLSGSIEVRCGNLMLEKKNLEKVVEMKTEEVLEMKLEKKTNNEQEVVHIEDWDEEDEDDDDCVILD